MTKQPDTYTITTRAARSMFGKRTGGYVAELQAGSTPKHRAQGPDSARAKQALLAELAQLADAPFSRRYVICADGTVLAVYLMANGAAYDIVSPTREHVSSAMLPAKSIADAVAVAGEHAGQSYGGVVRVL